MTDLDDAIITGANLKTYLKKTGTEEDTRLANSATWASMMASAYCERRFTLMTHEEYLEGDGTPRLYLAHWPVAKPLSVLQGGTGNVWESIEGAYTDTALLVERNPSTGIGDYFVHAGESGKGCIERTGGGGRGAIFGGSRGGGWSTYSQSIKVIYPAGYSVVPANVVHLVTRLAAIAFKRAERGLDIVTSESIQAGGGSITAIADEIPKDIRAGLDKWRRAMQF